MDEEGEIADTITACVVETMNTSTEEVAVESTSFYELGLENVWLFLIAFFTLFIIIRLGTLFIKYVKTGEIGDFENDSFTYNIMNGDIVKALPALVSGTFPGAILVDILGSVVITLFGGVLWPVLAILLPIIGLAYLIRRPIAKKQEFIAKLDGTHKDMTDNEGDCGP